MEEIQAKTGKFALIFGAILGGAFLVFNLMLYFMDMHYSRDTAITVVVMSLMLGIIIWGILSFRKANNGFLKLSQALKIGAGIALIAALMTILYTVFLSNVLDPEFATKTAEIQREVNIADGFMSDEQIEQQYEGTINYFWMSYPFILILYIIFGLIFGLIGGLMLKKQNPID